MSSDWTHDDVPGVRFERRGAVAVVTIDRPAARNSLTMTSQAELIRRWEVLQADDDVHVVVVTGADDPDSPPERQSFCVGTDVKELESGSVRPDPDASPLGRGFPSLGALDGRTPAIAAVNGYCIGGGMTMLLATDLRVASPFATFGLPELPLGMIPTNGAVRRALSDLPRAAAMQLMLLSDRMDAARAHELGLVNAVVPPDDVLPTALAWAQHIANLPPLALRTAMELAARTPRLAPRDFVRLESIMLETLRRESTL